jgi:hypothetical protein
MRIDLHSLLVDIKAAARIGHAESLWVALDGIFDLPEVAGNPPMQPAFLRGVLLPIGEVLASPRVAAAMLQPLAKHDHAAIRAIAAVAFAHRYFREGQSALNDLAALGRDPRKDVRQALIFALGQAGKECPGRLESLIKRWIENDSRRLQATALQLLPSLAKIDPNAGLQLLTALQPSSDPQVRTALVECLVELAQGELVDEVLALLKGWGAKSGNNLWVICKTLSRSWAVSYADSGLEILTQVAAQHGPEKAILNALKAMSRHGADQAIAQAVERWRQDPNPQLRALAGLVVEKSIK